VAEGAARLGCRPGTRRLSHRHTLRILYHMSNDPPRDDAKRRWWSRYITPGTAFYFLFLASFFLVGARWEPWALKHEFPKTYLPSTVGCVTPFSPDGSLLMTTSLDRTVRVWDVRTARNIAVLKGHISTGVRCASFSPHGSRIVTTCGDGARVWDVKTGQMVSMLKGPIWHAAFLPDGRQIASALTITPQDPREFYAQVWEADTGKLLRSLEGYPRHPSFSPDGRHLFTLGPSETFRLWDIEAGRALWQFEARGQFLDQAVSPNGSTILLAFVKRMYILDLKSGRELVTSAAEGHRMRLANFSPDGGRIVTAGFEGTARIWDARTGRMLCRLVGHGRTLNSAHFSPDGTRVATAGDDGTVRIWDADSGEQLWLSSKHGGLSGSGVFFGPQGEHLVTQSPVRIFRRRRPEWWWGHFYRPEVWAAAVFGMIWLGSVVRFLLRRLRERAGGAA